VALLFDENLSAALIGRISDLWPGSEQIVVLGLQSASDTLVWDYAKSKRLTIVTKDRDFYSRAAVFGPPPQVVWLRLGNCTASHVEAVLRANVGAINSLRNDPAMSILIIDR
jgi:predicted nuclease of predicted toxin-antitoxin system